MSMSEWEPLEPRPRSQRARSNERTLAPLPRRVVSNPRSEPEPPAHVLSDSAWAPVSPEADGFIRIEDLFGILLRRRRVLVAAFLLVAVPSLFAALTQQSLYESTTLLFVKFGREFVYRTEVGEDQVFINRNQDTVINSELQILSSDGVISDAVKAVGIESLYPGLVANGEPVDEITVQRAANIFRTHVNAQAVPNADVIRVAFRHPDPELAQQAVTALIDRFMEKHVEIFSDHNSIEFLREKVPVYQRQLETAEGELRDFQARYPGFAPDQPRETLQRERLQIEAELVRIRNEIASVRAEPESPAVSKARANLLELQLKEQRLQGGLSRDLEEVRREIVMVEDFLQSQLGASGSRSRTRLGHLQSEQTRLKARLAQANEIDGQLPTLLSEHEQLVRNRDIAQQRYQSSSKRLAETRLSDELSRNDRAANIRILAKGQVPLSPVTLRRGLLVAFALALSLTVAILTTFLVEFLSPSR
jgi:uncharacterized protein involved in exopolysaccharide biosynthesis